MHWCNLKEDAGFFIHMYFALLASHTTLNTCMLLYFSVFDSIESLQSCFFYYSQFFPCETDIDLKDSVDSFWSKIETHSDLFQVTYHCISTSAAAAALITNP